MSSPQHHICYRTGDVGFAAMDVREDEASFAAFGEIIGSATAQVGLEANPKVFPAHVYVDVDGVHNP